MSRGKQWPSESRSQVDSVTGVRVRQVTDHPSIHHHPFYYLPAYDNGMVRLIFVSHRTGRPEIFAERRTCRTLIQLTEEAALCEWSVHPSHDGAYVYFTTDHSACRVDCETFRVELLLDFGDIAMREEGMVGAAMGTTSLSHDDRYWAVPVKVGDVSRLVIIDTATGGHEVILERDSIGHPEFHPSDNGRLRYAGPYDSRIWVVNRDGSDNRLVYKRDVARSEWVVHETWNPAKPDEIITVSWPNGCVGIDMNTGITRSVCGFNAWHPSISRDGRLMCADTNFPDHGLQLFNPQDGIGEPRPLCLSGATNEGKHWDTDHCPYDDESYQRGEWTVYAPQHTHPHPAFSPDGQFVVFTSDRTGVAQVYEVELPT